MAVLNVTTFNHLAKDRTGTVAQAAQHPATGLANITFTTTEGTGPDFDASVNLVRLHSDTNCFYLIASAATVTTSTGIALPADTIEYVAVTPGTRIAVIHGP